VVRQVTYPPAGNTSNSAAVHECDPAGDGGELELLRRISIHEEASASPTRARTSSLDEFRPRTAFNVRPRPGCFLRRIQHRPPARNSVHRDVLRRIRHSNPSSRECAFEPWRSWSAYLDESYRKHRKLHPPPCVLRASTNPSLFTSHKRREIPGVGCRLRTSTNLGLFTARTLRRLRGYPAASTNPGLCACYRGERQWETSSARRRFDES